MLGELVKKGISDNVSLSLSSSRIGISVFFSSVDGRIDFCLFSRFSNGGS